MARTGSRRHPWTVCTRCRWPVRPIRRAQTGQAFQPCTLSTASATVICAAGWRGRRAGRGGGRRTASRWPARTVSRRGQWLPVLMCQSPPLSHWAIRTQTSRGLCGSRAAWKATASWTGWTSAPAGHVPWAPPAVGGRHAGGGRSGGAVAAGGVRPRPAGRRPYVRRLPRPAPRHGQRQYDDTTTDRSSATLGAAPDPNRAYHTRPRVPRPVENTKG